MFFNSLDDFNCVDKIGSQVLRNQHTQKQRGALDPQVCFQG